MTTRRGILGLFLGAAVAPLVPRGVLAAEPLPALPIDLMTPNEARVAVGLPRLIRDVGELSRDEMSVLMRTGEVPGVCRQLGWIPMELRTEPGDFPVVNIEDTTIARVQTLIPTADEAARWGAEEDDFEPWD